MGTHGPGGGLPRKPNTSHLDDILPDISKRKQNKDVEKPKLDNARQLRGRYFIEPDDEEFKLLLVLLMPTRAQDQWFKELYTCFGGFWN